jgi:hypothetical protein
MLARPGRHETPAEHPAIRGIAKTGYLHGRTGRRNQFTGDFDIRERIAGHRGVKGEFPLDEIITIDPPCRLFKAGSGKKEAGQQAHEKHRTQSKPGGGKATNHGERAIKVDAG